MNHNKHFAVLQEMRFRSINRKQQNIYTFIETCRSHPSFFVNVSLEQSIQHTFDVEYVSVLSINAEHKYTHTNTHLVNGWFFWLVHFLILCISSVGFWPITLLFNHIWLIFHSIFFSPNAPLQYQNVEKSCNIHRIVSISIKCHVESHTATNK